VLGGARDSAAQSVEDSETGASNRRFPGPACAHCRGAGRPKKKRRRIQEKAGRGAHDMTTRRSFLQVTSAGALLTGLSPQLATTADFDSELEARDTHDLTKEDLPTPSLILDREIFDKNLNRMNDHSKATGLKIRPHVKIHKCVEVARRQLALGAIGLTTATIAESELMSAAGFKGVFWTRQPAGRNNISRAVALSKRDTSFLFVVDDTVIADQVEEAAAAAGTRCTIVVDVFAGLTRHGMQAGAPALALAQKVDTSKHLRLHGLMGYSGWASHTQGWEERCKKSREDLQGLLETVELCRKAGLPIQIISGGSTGTYNIDKENGLTELQCGSYVFMDTAYRKIGGKQNPGVYDDFGSSLTVMTTVVSKRHPNQCTIDAGNKALLRPTDEAKGMPWITVENQGAEYGILKWKDGDRDLKLGDRVELYPTNLDMSVNVYDRIYVARGEQIVDVWPIMGRSGAAQR
jgi:D-serine deaminase-like pyridoxal phosphate-dependent protein